MGEEKGRLEKMRTERQTLRSGQELPSSTASHREELNRYAEGVTQISEDTRKSSLRRARARVKKWRALVFQLYRYICFLL